jgi:two-component system NtrC family sensor kinase
VSAAPVDEPRRITSLGRTPWSNASAAAIDARLGAVLLDNITSRLALIDREGRYVYANREMLEFLGWNAQELTGRHVRDVIGRDAFAGYMPLHDRVWSGETVRIEGWVTFPQRGRRYMTETFVPYGPEGGDLELVAVFGRDHTELKNREVELAEGLEKLHHSEALKSAIFDHAFAALVSTDAPAASSSSTRGRGDVRPRRADVLGRPSAR